VAVAGVAVSAMVIVPSGTSSASDGESDGGFHQTNLVSNLSTVGAQLVDPSLKNPWGLAAGPATPVWVADNGADVATIYPGAVNGSPIVKAGLAVAVPGGAPTGQVFNPTADFVAGAALPKSPARFILSTENGSIVAWNPAAAPNPQATTAEVEYANPTAVYKGLAIAATLNGSFLYASNFHDGSVDVFDSKFTKVVSPGGFVDASLPNGYAPFGIQNLHGLIYVTYALQDAERHDDVRGRGHGFIDVFTTDGFLLHRLASRGSLDSPWGMAIAPAGFGRFSGQLLVGNFGNGRINVLDPISGEREGQLRGDDERPIAIDGLWGLLPGNGATGGPASVIFSAGLNDEADGLVGTLTASA
jgi:uncharacterized protein (TIGR03118 family)